MNTIIIIVFHSSFSLAGMVTNISLVAEREGEGDGESRDRSAKRRQKREALSDRGPSCTCLIMMFDQ